MVCCFQFTTACSIFQKLPEAGGLLHILAFLWIFHFFPEIYWFFVTFVIQFKYI